MPQLTEQQTLDKFAGYLPLHPFDELMCVDTIIHYHAWAQTAHPWCQPSTKRARTQLLLALRYRRVQFLGWLEAADPTWADRNACPTCAGSREVDAGGSAYDGIRICLKLFETDDLPCPDCCPKMALQTLMGLADTQAFNH